MYLPRLVLCHSSFYIIFYAVASCLSVDVIPHEKGHFIVIYLNLMVNFILNLLGLVKRRGSLPVISCE